MSNPYGTFRSNWKHEVSIRGIKILDIGLLFVASSIIGYISARILSYIFKFDKKNMRKMLRGKLN
jgi:hypothetical protein